MTEPTKLRTTSSKSASLEALRGLAALVVLLGHLVSHLDVQHRWLAPVQPLVNWGTEAVILFFLLSGVVIRLSEERRRRRPWDFALDRVVRIYPLYLFALAVACGAAWWLGVDLSHHAVIGNLFFVQSLQGYIAPTIPTDPPFWSLSFEMTFYAAFALVLANRRTLRLWWVVALLSLCSFPIALSSPWASHFRMIFAFSTIWLLGYAIAEHRDRFRVERASAIAVLPLAFAWARIHFTSHFYDPFRLLGFGVFLLPLFSSLVGRASREIRFGVLLRLALCAGTLALLWTRSPSHTSTKLVLSLLAIIGCAFGPYLAPRPQVPRFAMRGLVYLGSISYALYVVHYPILQLTVRAVGNAAADILIVFAVAIALSHLLERIVQPRIARAVRRLRTGAPTAELPTTDPAAEGLSAEAAPAAG